MQAWPAETSCFISNAFWFTGFYRSTIFVRVVLMLLKSDSDLQKKIVLFAGWKAF